jgi:glycyl-tRNA synthetase beta chain
MTYQLETDCELPGWSSVHFVRPAHGLVALHGSTVVPVKALGLTAGNTTQGHRFEAAQSPVVIVNADAYAQALRDDGAVIASFAERRAEIVRQLAAARAQGGQRLPPDRRRRPARRSDRAGGAAQRAGLPVRAEFLDVPQECLILTMKANQKYFPLLDAQAS